MNYDKIPQELKDLKQWVCWKRTPLPNGKVNKLPINPYNGLNAMSNTPATWGTFEEALTSVTKYNLAGVGFMFANGYFGVDLDNCTEELKQEFMTELQSYTEVSQSGNGIHIICKGKLPEGARRKAGIEMYETNRFFVMTGNLIGTPTVEERTKEVKKLHKKYLQSPKEELAIYTYEKKESSPKLEDSEVIRKASNSKNGHLFNLLFAGNWEGVYPSQSEADMAFAMLLAFWTNKDVEQMDRIIRLSGLMREKWNRKQNNTTYGAITLNNAINKTKNTYSVDIKEEAYLNPATGEVDYTDKKEYELNDTGNAHRFADRFGDQIKYNFDNKQFMIWDGIRWVYDTQHTVRNMVEVVITEMKKDAMSEEDANNQKSKIKNVQHAFSSRGKDAMLKEAMHINNIPCTNANFDNNKKMFNTLGGVVDLSKGLVLPHDKSFSMSKLSPFYIAVGEPQRWLKFLNEIFNGDTELIRFVQKAVGYTLTGSIKEQCMFICYGDGANGKSVFLDVISTLMGEYASNAQVETLLYHKNQGSGSSDLARLKGSRMITTSEPNEGSKFNEGLIKQLTGGDKITARFLYGKEFEFKPEFKIWLATNYKPVIRGTDQGIWRRIRLIPFEMHLSKQKQDKDLTSKLLKELPEIINWAIEGCKLWLKEGLENPKSVEDATKDYKNEMDMISSFVEQNCQEIPNWETAVSDVYQVYSDWAKRGNEYLMPLTRFGKEMSKRFERKRKASGVVYVGVRLNKDSGSYTYDKYST
jgi:putative DNA primase/helicase